MAFDLDASGVNDESEFGGANRVRVAGMYHVTVKKCDDSMEKFDKIIAELEVQAGRPGGEEHRTHTEFFSVSDKSIPRLTRFAMATGLMKPGERKKVNLAEAEGRQLVVELEEHAWKDKETGEEKKGLRVSYMGMWSVHHPDVKDVPKNPDVLKYGPKPPSGNGSANGNGASNGNGSGGGGEKDHAAGGAGDDWAGLV